MNTEKFHNQFNAAYFSFAALRFAALLGSTWWGGASFAIATPLNTILLILGIGYIVAAMVCIKHACCGLSWVGCSCNGRSRANVVRTIAMLLPIPVFAYFIYGQLVKLSFDDSPRSLQNVKTQLELDRMLFGNVRAEGVTWSLAKKAFKSHYDEMGDRITLLVLGNMKERGASAEEVVKFLNKHTKNHDCDECAFKSPIVQVPVMGIQLDQEPNSELKDGQGYVLISR